MAEKCDLNQRISRWEASRAIRNLMGRMSQETLYRNEEEFLAMFWSSRADICLGVNDGWYIGPHAIRVYYAALAAGARSSDAVLRSIFSSETAETDHNIGQFDLKPLSSDLVEIAEDGETAKGMWTCQGSDIRMTDKGPISYWTVGIYAGDFILEDGEWRLWHLLDWKDIDRPCGEKWWEPEKERLHESEFERMGRLERPQPTVCAVLHELWYPGRPAMKMPPCPEPYRTFSETFSYGFEESGGHAG